MSTFCPTDKPGQQLQGAGVMERAGARAPSGTGYKTLPGEDANIKWLRQERLQPGHVC